MNTYIVHLSAEKFVTVKADHVYVEDDTLTFYNTSKMIAAFRDWVSFTICVGETK